MASVLYSVTTLTGLTTATKATTPDSGAVNYSSMYSTLTAKIKTRYDSLGVAYKGYDNSSNPFGSIKTITGRTPYLYHSDHLGSSSLITSFGGQILQNVQYMPFGEVLVDQNIKTWDMPYKFNGKALDEETGLYYYGARYYDPRTSVWLGVDPLAEKYPNVSSYVYCMNNPVKYVDLDGRDWILSTGDKSFWYGGQVGDKRNLINTYKTTSGYKGPDRLGNNVDYQNSKFQRVKHAGPTPEGLYHINLKHDPNRVAQADLSSGELKKNDAGGIEKIPISVDIPNKPGKMWTYSEWGENRASLIPDNVTGATNVERDNTSYYYHDSSKGFTHGCNEVDPALFVKLNEYRDAGNSKIDVVVKNPDQNYSTNGGTKKIETN